MIHFIMQYIFYNRDEREHEVIVNKIKDDVNIGGEEMRTIVDKFLDEGESKGIKKGIEQGIEKGIDKTALNMIKEGMGDDIINRITGFSIKRIKKLRDGQK